MAYPQIATYQTGFTTVNATSTTITVPTGTQDKDLLLLFFSKDGTAAPSTPANWSLLAGGSSGASYFSVFYRKLTGSISDFTVTHASEQTSWVIVRIPLGDTPVINTVATGTSTAPNSGSLSSGFSLGIETLYLSACGWDSNDDLSSYPTGMALYNFAADNTSSQGSGAAIAGVESTASSFDPAAFSLSGSEEWAAFTLAVKLIPITEKTLTTTSNISSALQTSVLYVGYYIERKVDSGAWELLTYDSASPYVDYDIDPGSTYCYRVRYWDGSEYSVYSNEDCEMYPSGGSTPKALSSGITMAGHVQRQTIRNILGQVFTAGSFFKATSRNLIGYAVVTTMTVRHIARSIAGSIAESVTLERTRTILRAIATAVSTTVTVTRTSLRNVVSWVNLSGAVLKWTDSRKMTTSNSTATSQRLTSRSFSGPITLSASTLHQAFKVLSATVSTAATALRDFTVGTIEKVLNATIKATATAQKSILKTLIGYIQTIRSVFRSTGKALTRSVYLSDFLIKDIVSIKLSGIKETTTILRATFRAFTAVTRALASLMRQTTRLIIATTLVSGIATRSLTIVKAIIINICDFGQVTRKAEKRLTRSTTFTSSVSRMKVALKTLISSITVAGSILKEINRTLVSFVNAISSARRSASLAVVVTISSFGQNLRQTKKWLTISKTITSTTTRMKVTLKNIVASIMATTSIRREISRFLTSPVNAICTTRRSTLRTFIVAINAHGQTLRQLVKWLVGSVTIASTIFRMKVALKTLMIQITTVGSIHRDSTRTIAIDVSTTSAVRKAITRSFAAALTILSMARRQIDIVLEASVHMLTSLAHSSVIMRTLTVTTLAASTAIRVTFKMAITGANIAGSVWHQTFKIISEVASTTAQISRMIAREIRSDLDAIGSTFRITARDVGAALSASTIGSDIHKIVVMVYYKTVTAITSATVAIKRHAGRIFLTLIHAAGSRNSAGCHAETGVRTVTLSTTNRILILSIGDQEGSPLEMAYTGDTIRLYGRFYNWSGVLADVTLPVVIIYDGKGNEITTGVPSKESSGVYYYDYLIPSSYSDPLIFEMRGILEGSTILARSTIERRWV